MQRYYFLYYFLGVFLGVSFLTRTLLFLATWGATSHSFGEILSFYVVGFFYDLVAYCYYIIPFVLYLFIVPNKMFNAKWHRKIALGIFFVVLYSVLFNGVSEWFFWEEFGKRFNFIAVDYLVYTHEVIKNIQESYPMPLLLSIIFLLTVVIFLFIRKRTDGFDKIFKDRSIYRERIMITILLLSLPFIAFYSLKKQSLSADVSVNRYNQELAKNGFYSLFSAFRNNELPYDEFYKHQPIQEVLKHYRTLVGSKEASFISNDLNNTLKRVSHSSQEKHYNVMLVMIESMSASYMGIYGDQRSLTPKLDTLIKKSLFFDHFFATGTRTVRGMEAVTMSVPPTSGRSIVKRPDNHNMAGMGWIFKAKGYENKFIYAGHGYFDNMNEYFSHNGFSIIDRLSFEENEIIFSNVWGACDEDLFNKSIQEADNSYAKHQPFFSFIMTTSNHRPYTYPNGRIDIPSHSGRQGGVKYTDYAIDDFLKKASKKPWFENTLFIFVADHNGGSAGKTELPLYRYKIPLIVYAPKIIRPQIVSKVSSQIDLAPTLFGILGWNYESKMYGQNILSDDFRERALIGNYQKLGLYQDGKLTILMPNQTIKEVKVEELALKSNRYKEILPLQKDINDSIGYYQSASYFYKHHLDRISQ
jgi:phosphoglycerol transferase MdoB-like AlkP superfamily enzyme